MSASNNIYQTSFAKLIYANATSLAWLLAIGLFVFSALMIFDRHFYGDTSPLFWDLPVYVAAVNAYAAGANPYDNMVLQQYGGPAIFDLLSPPSITWIFWAVGQTPLRYVFGEALLTLHIVALIGTPLALGRLFFNLTLVNIALCLACFLTHFSGAGIGAFGAANNGTILYFLICLSLYNGFKNDDWRIFHVVVAIAAMFKPFYGFFWVAPILYRGFSWKQLGFATIGASIAVLSYLLPIFLDPLEVRAWLNNLQRQLLIRGDSGDNVFTAVNNFFSSESNEIRYLPYIAQIIFNVILLLCLFMIPFRDSIKWALLIVAAIFWNPRILAYDTAIVSVPLAYLTSLLLPKVIPYVLRFSIAIGLLFILLFIPYKNIVMQSSVLFPLVIVLIFFVYLWLGFKQRIVI